MSDNDEENGDDLQDTQQVFQQNNDTGANFAFIAVVSKLIQKSKVKGMAIIPMNMVAATDFMETGRIALAECRLVQTRELEKQRNMREDYYLREKLFARLESMEEDSARSDRLLDGIETMNRCTIMFLEYKRERGIE